MLIADRWDNMRVLMVTNNFFPYRGGVARSVELFSEGLRCLGNAVRVVAPDFGVSEQQAHVNRVTSILKLGYKGRRIAIPVLPTSEIRGIIAEFKPDIVHVHHPFLLGPAAVRTAKELGIPVVFTYHTRYEEYLHYFPGWPVLKSKILKMRVRKFCSLVSHVLVPGRSVLGHVLFDKKTVSFSILPSPVADEFFVKDNVVRQKRAFGTAIKLITVTRIEREKNLKDLVSLSRMAVYLGAEITIVGYGSEEEWLRRALYRLHKLPIRLVRLVISPTRSVIAHLCRSSDLFFFVSKSETQGMVLVEAMATGLPIVALSASGVNDIVQSKQTGFICHSVGEMLSKVKFFQQHKEELAAMSVAANIRARSYAVRQLAEGLMAVYQKQLCSKL